MYTHTPYPHSNNVFKQELWDAGYRWCSDSNGSVVFVSQYRVFSWKILESTYKGGREAKPLLLYRRPASRLDFVLGTGIGCLLYLVSLILFMWQPWRTDFAGSSRAFLSNFLPLLARWWMRIELKHSGERITDPYLNSMYKVDPRSLLF
ncbi:hypothetical protein E4T56_gene5682 [Termitomyces sp. T112]|nr:hypothetical protein E4T56_gene5682 [Termitomyces sp. T112]